VSKRVTRLSLPEFMDIFLWEETRKVDKTGCVSLDGNHYEVDLELCRARVELRYDPFDLTHRMDRRVKPESHLVEEADGQISFLELAEQKRQAALREQDSVSYAIACCYESRGYQEA
jgi:hypothetical protein